MDNTAWKVSVFEVILVRILPHSGWIRRDLRISPYSVRMQTNANQNNSKYRHFLRSVNSAFDKSGIQKFFLTKESTVYFF